MLQIIIPMSGYGKRFDEAGYGVPKPFVPIQGIPMYEKVIENVTPLRREDYKITVITRPELVGMIDETKCTVVTEDKPIGAATSVMRALSAIDPDPNDEVLVANSDQLVDWPDSIDNLLDHAKSNRLDGDILTLPADEPKYSYAQVLSWYDADTDQHVEEVIRVAEKKVISPYGTVGIYWFKRYADFKFSVDNMISADDRFNGEFYLCPAYNYMPRNKTIGHLFLQKTRCHFLGDPESYEDYIKKLSV